MKALRFLIAMGIVVAQSAMAQSGHDMATTNHDGMTMRDEASPAESRDPHAYADGYTLDSGKYALPGPRQLKLGDEHNFGTLRVDRFEYAGIANGGRTASYDLQGWFGRDYDRLVIKAEGDYAKDRLQEARSELLWSHAFASYWDTQIGARHDSGIGPNRTWLAFGVQGLAPYWFDIEATAYLGNDGRSALRLATEYEWLLTQRLILQPRAEFNFYGKRDTARDIGSGLSDGVAGLRLRYEFSRQFAPYIGIERAEKFGQSADFARSSGEPSGGTRWVAGLRLWF